MRISRKHSFLLRLGLFCLLGLFVTRAVAFALLGPYEPWMTATNGFRQLNDVGGPMDLTNEYRWNVPMVTYGFDKSFLDYFGSNGVAAVEAAIEILNELPPASEMELTNYALDASFNFTAQGENVLDLKSAALALLVEQMGLASPARNIGVLRQWTPMFLTNMDESSWPSGTIPSNVLLRNFDPETLLPTQEINGILYDLAVLAPDFITSFPFDPLASPFSAVADAEMAAGAFYPGLTADDAGGLRYLISTNNINFETLLPTVRGAGTNAMSWVNGALRPGVNKINFSPHALDTPTGAFLPMTNQFTDIYITNGVQVRQQVERVIAQPDIVFSAEDMDLGPPFSAPLFRRKSTTNWVNDSTNAGPGIIQPGVKIVFNKLSSIYTSTAETGEESFFGFSPLWGTFDDSTNPVVIYPVTQSETNLLTIRLWLTRGDYPYEFKRDFEWCQRVPAGQYFILQTSTDLLDWRPLLIVSADGAVDNYWNSLSSEAHRFYRLVPDQ